MEIDRNQQTPTGETGLVGGVRPGLSQRAYPVKVLGVSGFLMIGGRRDQKLAAIAQAQRGRVARSQLLAAGITQAMISWMLKGGRLHRLHRGVYAVGHVAPIELGRETAALLAVGEGAVLSHRSAAAVWGLVAPADNKSPIDVTVTYGGSQRSGIRVHRSQSLTSDDLRIKSGLPLTAPARTLLDFAGSESERQVERAFDEALVKRIIRASEITTLVECVQGHHGGAVLSRLLERRGASTITRSEAEERFLALIRAAGLPPPEVNARIHGYEVDFLWRDQHVVVEVDGYRYHSSRASINRDRRKEAALRGAGLDVSRVSWDQMVDEAYAVVAGTARTLALAPHAA